MRISTTVPEYVQFYGVLALHPHCSGDFLGEYVLQWILLLKIFLLVNFDAVLLLLLFRGQKVFWRTLKVIIRTL